MTQEAGKGTLRPAMAWIHGWLGLVPGWILFAMFLTGTASYFRPEITRWMQPERRAVAVAPARAAAAAVPALERVGAGADEWIVYLPNERETAIRAYVQPGGGKPFLPRLDIDPETGAKSVARETAGGDLFYRFHYTLGLPGVWGYYIAGLCALAMLAAIVSGVVTHKRILVDMFTMRWGKGQRSWLDGHNLVSVLGLPYHALITYTGLLTLIVTLMPWPIVANYATPERFYAEAYRSEADVKAQGRRVPGVPLGRIVADAERRWGGVPAQSLTVSHPGDAAATVTVVATPGAGLTTGGPALRYAIADGRLLPPPIGDAAAIATYKTMFGLHLAWFAGPALRWLLFLLGLAGTAMVGSGLVLWTIKRTRATPSRGWRLAARLNVATIAGLPAAMAAYFLANRLIPADLAARAAIEQYVFYGIWLALAVGQWLRPLHSAWIETLAIGAILFAAAALADVTIVGWPHDALFASVDAALVAAAATLTFAARRVRRPATPHLRVRRSREVAHAR